MMRNSQRVALLALVGAFLGVSGPASSQPAGGQPAGGEPAEAEEAAPAESTPAPAKRAGRCSTGDLGVGSGSSAAGKIKSGAPPPKKPSAAQLRAFKLLREELGTYKSDAKDYKKTLTMIVRHHYEERRRRVLSALDKELDIEKKGLDVARDEAIKRLEEFIARYSGENKHPVATPDAMFRLAALYEEKARVDFDSDLAVSLKPAVDLYLRIIREFPTYEETAGVHYYLGHAYLDMGRLEEAQQSWRVLVCHNHFKVTDDVAKPAGITVQELAQDHDDKFWQEWYNTHPLPLDQGKMTEEELLAAPVEEEMLYRNPYPDSCQPLPQNLPPNVDPKYVAEIWWRLGDYHFDNLDPKGGPYNMNRALTAYERSMTQAKPPLYGVVMYKRAWAYFKQQRYKTAIEWFVKLLDYADEQERKTGDPGADFRQEAFTYIAGSLTYVDMEGPPANHPNIARSDVLDLETDPVVAEDKMAVAIERVQDEKLIPQDKEWVVGIYKSLAQEFIEITQNRNAIKTLELTLRKFPMDRDAPIMQNRVAELYESLAKLAPEGSAAKDEFGSKALEARTKLAAYVGTTPWTDANKDDLEALQQAELLVRQGLKRAAADHTNLGRALFNRAISLSDAGEQVRLLEKAVAEYRLADEGWGAYLEQDPNSLDSYETRFWLADARYQVVRLQVIMEKSPSNDDVFCARQALVSSRDSNEDDKYQQPAAVYLVDLSEQVLTDEYRKFDVSSGSEGIEKRESVRFTNDDPKQGVIKDPVPKQVVEAVVAREEYNARIPLERDPGQNGLPYAFQSGEYYFAYGQFEEARKRFKPLYDKYCGKNEWGYKAWEKLISMANFENDKARSRELIEAKSCAIDADQKAGEKNIKDPALQQIAFDDAAKLFEKAKTMPDGPERDATWRAVAAAYKAALEAGPDRDEAPEAAINGAYAYKQVSEYDKAIEMYELFIAKYGNEEKLQELKNGKDDKPAQPEKYKERVGYLRTAYDAMAGSYILFFDYPKAAQTFDKISKIEHFEQEHRRNSAKQALTLYASLGDQGGMKNSKQQFFDLGASPKEEAEAEFIIANAEVKKWDEFSADEGANANARRKAQAAMEGYWRKFKNKNAAAKYLVETAYNTAKLKRAGKQPGVNTWWNNTIKAWDTWNRLAPRENGASTAQGSREADMAAEADFVQIDEDLRKKFDYETGHHRYAGKVTEVIAEYNKDAREAKVWHDKLGKVITKYVSPEYTIAARARQGSVYDSLRTGLYNTRPPKLVLFDKKTERLLSKLENSDDPELQEKADGFRVKIQQAWRDKRERELNSSDEIAVRRYAEAVVLSRRYNISNPTVVRAIRRLAFLTDVIGEAKMKQYTSKVKDLNYTEGMFTRIRPGMVTQPKSEGMPRPLPVAN